MHKIYFVTTNPVKVMQAKEVLEPLGFSVEQIDYDYQEIGETTGEVAKRAAKECAEKFDKEVFVDDTGCELKAYPGFPGAQPKFVFNSIGYDGIFRLIEGKTREASWIASVGYCKPGGEPQLFEGFMEGVITNKVHGECVKAMPYQNIFIPKGEEKVMLELPEEKKHPKHRTTAFRKLAEYLEGENK